MSKRTLKIESFGEDAAGITIKGDPRSPEPSHVRINFPGGHVEVTRAQDNNPETPYWVHVYVNHPGSTNYLAFEPAAQIVDARLDQTDKQATDADLGDFKRPELYHLAVRVERTGDAKTSRVE